MVEFINSIKEVRANTAPYMKWKQERKDKEAQRQALHSSTNLSQDQLDIASSYGRAIVDAVNVMDDYSENKAEDVEVATQQAQGLVPLIGGAVGALPILLYKALAKNPNPKVFMALAPLPIVSMFAGIFGSFIIAANIQKTASRIARYQARETELKDPKNFVVFNPEQLQAAQEIAKTLPDDNTKKEKSALNPFNSLKEVISTVKSLLKDKKAYKQWQKDNKLAEQDRTKLFNIKETPGQLANAKAHQDNLFRIINKIDIASQDYSENIEMATNSMIAAGFVGGGVAGGLISGAIWLLEKAHVISKNASFIPKIKKLALPVTTVTLGLLAALYSVKLQKEAARVGRFKAKQELLQDPHNFISYSEEQLNTVSNIKAPEEIEKGFLGKLKDEFDFFIQARKDFKEYKEYKKTKAKEEDKLRSALKQVQVSDVQLNEAKKLQEKAFRVFDKMDEMSQRYSEDVEAGTQIIAQAVAPIVSVAGTGLGIALTLLTKAGPIAAMSGSLLISIPAAFGLEIWATRLQKKASKIGLFKAMQDLKDPKNFVDYTDKQILQAQNFQGSKEHTPQDKPSQQNNATIPDTSSIPNIQSLQTTEPVIKPASISSNIVSSTNFTPPAQTITYNVSSDITNWLNKISGTA